MSTRSDKSICVFCNFYNGGNTCLAFPVAIPYVIVENLHDHRIPYPGDNDITFETDDEAGKEYAEKLFGEGINNDN